MTERYDVMDWRLALHDIIATVRTSGGAKANKALQVCLDSQPQVIREELAAPLLAPVGDYRVGLRRFKHLYRELLPGIYNPADPEIATFVREADARYVAELCNADLRGMNAVTRERHHVADDLDVMSHHDGECTSVCDAITAYVQELRTTSRKVQVGASEPTGEVEFQ